MKTGKTLVELATEIERQRDNRVDYVAATSALKMVDSAEEESPRNVRLESSGFEAVGINDLAHRQIGTHTEIPATYYDRLRDKAPALLRQNVNHWFEADQGKRMVRTLDSRVRAFVSDRFRPLENADLAEAALPALLAKPELAIVSCDITERRLYIKAVDKAVVREINGRHVIDGRSVDYDHASPSLTISNSEVGAGALSVETGLFKHGCRNMAMFRERSMRKYHVGGKHDLADGMVSMLSHQTRNLIDAATWAQVRDVVANAFNPDAFEEQVAIVQGMVEQKLTGDVVKVVEIAGKRLGISEGERKGVLKHLIEGGDLSRFGLFNAVTRTAEDLEDYDRATDFERMGGQIIELPANDWKVIAEAA